MALHKSAGADTPWRAYPRPQLRRDNWVNLNGSWDFTVTDGSALPDAYDKTILVPFCPESRLSGIEAHFPEGSSLFYRRYFPRPETDGRVLLHIGGADQKAYVYVNRRHLCTHIGGYEAFTVDITDALRTENELVIRVTDDLRPQIFPYGKQVLRPHGMWYTPVSGIWQTVWLECVPENYVNSLDIQVTLTQAVVRVAPPMDGTVTLDSGERYPLSGGVAFLTPANPQVWSPDNPKLYGFTLTAGGDTLHSYFALRTLSVQSDGRYPRLCLNGKPFFFHGLLDQGYWPDGLFTPATPECYAQDIAAAKALGFNTLRKHIKVEPEQFYYDCDRLGMVVFQDMVNNGRYCYLRDTVLPTIGLQTLPDRWLHRDPETRKAFLSSMEATVAQLKNHPCIAYWTIFNEGWGQFDSDSAYTHLKALDGSRFLDSTSGWFRRKKTDVDSRHIYFGPWHLNAHEKPLVLSEFGGHACAIKNHQFHPGKSFGYRQCATPADLLSSILSLYQKRILPMVSKGLCAAIYTQISDVEDEVNGLLTYDRQIVKVDAAPMLELAASLQKNLPTDTP